MGGGHDVPIKKIISRYSKSIANCAFLASIVDRLYVYDNSIENTFPVLLFRANEGRLTKQYAEIHDWANIIYQAVKDK
jgi:predicted ABC-type ATPase